MLHYYFSDLRIRCERSCLTAQGVADQVPELLQKLNGSKGFVPDQVQVPVASVGELKLPATFGVRPPESNCWLVIAWVDMKVVVAVKKPPEVQVTRYVIFRPLTRQLGE